MDAFSCDCSNAFHIISHSLFVIVCILCLLAGAGGLKKKTANTAVGDGDQVIVVMTNHM